MLRQVNRKVKQTLINQMNYTVHELDALGFTISLPKSVLGEQIAQVIKHRGFILNSVDMKDKLTPKKVKGIEFLA